MSVEDRYREIYRRMLTETACLVFVKRNGEPRVMLCTRNIRTAELYGIDRDYALASLDGHDKKCNIANHNIAVLDLEIKQIRAFNIDRLVNIDWLGEIEDVDSADGIEDKYVKFKSDYMSNLQLRNLEDIV